MFQKSNERDQNRKRKKWMQTISVFSSEDEEEIHIKSKDKTIYNDDIIALRFPYPMFSEDSDDNNSSSPKKSGHSNKKNKKIVYRNRSKINTSNYNESYKHEKKKIKVAKDLKRSLKKREFENNLTSRNTDSSKHIKRNLLISSSENSSSEEIENSVERKSNYHKKRLKTSKKETDSVRHAVPIHIKKETSRILDSSESLTDENEFQSNKPIATFGINQAPRFRRLVVLSSSPASSDTDEDTNKPNLPVGNLSKPSIGNVRENYSRKRKTINSVFHSISSSSDEEENARFITKDEENINSQNRPLKLSLDKTPFKNLLTLSEAGLSKSKDLQEDNKLYSTNPLTSESGPKSSSRNQRLTKICDPKPLARTAWTSIGNAPLKNNKTSTLSQQSKIKTLKKQFISSNASSVEIYKHIQNKALNSKSKINERKSYIPKRSESLKKSDRRLRKFDETLQVPRSSNEERIGKDSKENFEGRKPKENNYTVNVNVFCSPTHQENMVANNEEYTSHSTSNSQKLDINLSLPETEACDKNECDYSRKVRISHAVSNQNDINQIEVVRLSQLTQKEAPITYMKSDHSKTALEENQTGCDVLGNILSEMENNRYKVQKPPIKKPIEPPSEMLGWYPVGVNPPFMYNRQVPPLQNQQQTNQVQRPNLIYINENTQSNFASHANTAPQDNSLMHKTTVPHGLPNNDTTKNRGQSGSNHKEHNYSFDKIKTNDGQQFMPSNSSDKSSRSIRILTTSESICKRKEDNSSVIKTNNFKPHISSVISLACNTAEIKPSSLHNEISNNAELQCNSRSTNIGNTASHSIGHNNYNQNNKDTNCDSNVLKEPENPPVNANDSLNDADPLTYLYDEPVCIGPESIHKTAGKESEEIRKDSVTNEQDSNEKDTSKGIRIRLGGAVFRVHGNSTLSREDKNTEIPADKSQYLDKDKGKIPMSFKDSSENVENHSVFSKNNRVIASLHKGSQYEDIKKTQLPENNDKLSTSSSDGNSEDSDNDDDSDKLVVRDDDSSSDSSDTSNSSGSSSTVKSRIDSSNSGKVSSKEICDGKDSTVKKHNSEDASEKIILDNKYVNVSEKDIIITITSSDSENDESDNTKLINTKCIINKVSCIIKAPNKDIHSAGVCEKEFNVAPSSEKKTTTGCNAEKDNNVCESLTETIITQFPETDSTRHDFGNPNTSVIEHQQNHKNVNSIGKIRVKSLKELGIILNNPLPENALPSEDKTPIETCTDINLSLQPTTASVALKQNKIIQFQPSHKIRPANSNLTSVSSMNTSSNNTTRKIQSQSTTNTNKVIVLIPVSHSNTKPTLEIPNSRMNNGSTDQSGNINLNENLHSTQTIKPVGLPNQQQIPNKDIQTNVQQPPPQGNTELPTQPSVPNTNEKETLFFKLCDELFTELVDLKIPTLVDELHLAIAYNNIKEERLKKLEQLISPETVATEKRRAEKDFAEMIKIRGQSFVPLFMTIVNKINKANLKALVTALYCRFIQHLERIDPVNANYRFKLRHIIINILQKHNTDGVLKEDVCSIFGQDTESFTTIFTFIENLLYKYDKYLEDRQKSNCNVTNQVELQNNSNASNDNQLSASTSTSVAFKHLPSSSEKQHNIGATAKTQPKPSGPPIGNLDELIFSNH